MSLTKVQLFYLERHADSPAEDLADATGASVRAVKAALKRIARDRAALAATLPPEQKASPHPASRQMATVMTSDDSARYERTASRSKIPPRLADDVTIVDPNLPVY